MKVLSVRQPYATLIVEGIKKVETRKWKTDHRGTLLIHATRPSPNENLTGFLSRNGFPPASDLPCQQIIGAVALAHCFSHDELEADADLNRITLGDERILGNFGPGWYSWWLIGAKKFHEPIPHHGSLMLWDLPRKWEPHAWEMILDEPVIA